MKIWWPLSKSWSHWQPHRLQRQALLKEDHEVIPMLRSLLTDTLCNLPGQERLQPHQWDLRPLLFSSGVGSFASQKNQIRSKCCKTDLRFFIFIREVWKVYKEFADVVTKAALSSQLFKDPECWSSRGLNP